MRRVTLNRTLASLASCLALTLLFACARTVEEWEVTLTNNDGRIVGTLVLNVTSRKTSDGNAAIARVATVTPLQGYYPCGPTAAVGITPSAFDADLNLGAYDNNTLLHGVRSGNRAEGTVETTSGAGGLLAGTFKASLKPR